MAVLPLVCPPDYSFGGTFIDIGSLSTLKIHNEPYVIILSLILSESNFSACAVEALSDLHIEPIARDIGQTFSALNTSFSGNGQKMHPIQKSPTGKAPVGLFLF